MLTFMKRVYSLGFLLVLLIMLMASSPLSIQTSHAAPVASSTSYATWTGKTTGWANVRSGPNTNSSIVTTYAPNTNVTVYATVSGQIVWGGISSWQRISSPSSAPLYIYGGLLTATSNPGGTPPPPPSPPQGTQAAHTTGWANVRNAPNTGAALVTTYAPNTNVTIYATVTGQVVWSGISTWYRVSAPNNAPLFVYGGLVAVNSSGGGGGGAPTPQGKVIVISLSAQWMHVFDNGREVFNTPITSGQPALPTPTGTYHVLRKLSPTTFYSPWPVGSPYYYPPTHINYALEWRSDGYFLHDATWRSTFGPGTNVWHNDPVFGRITGSHGCVNMSVSAAVWLYNWAPIGTTVQINP